LQTRRRRRAKTPFDNAEQITLDDNWKAGHLLRVRMIARAGTRRLYIRYILARLPLSSIDQESFASIQLETSPGLKDLQRSISASASSRHTLETGVWSNLSRYLEQRGVHPEKSRSLLA
jgi:hypothetical protein